MNENAAGHATAPTSKVSELTKEKIGDLYFGSLTNKLTRSNHILLGLDGSKATPPVPNIEPTPKIMRADFTSWYGGFITLAQMIDPGSTSVLPSTQTMADHVTKNFERAREAIAA
jgi:AICAR transformylase/IMP cyclohydrolase PurH